MRLRYDMSEASIGIGHVAAFPGQLDQTLAGVGGEPLVVAQGARNGGVVDVCLTRQVADGHSHISTERYTPCASRLCPDTFCTFVLQ